jgi:iron(III) transport system ATP-binding protein
VLRVQGLYTEYPNEQGEIVKAAQDVTFEVPEGKLFTLLGPSGCGKTTTLRSIAGLERPRVGEIAVNDRVVYSSAKGVFVAPNRRGFGMVFQSYAIWPHMNVFQNAAFPLEVGDKKYSRQEVRDKVMKVLKAVQLDHLADREATKLSGGQQQRLALARALARNPEVLFLDEPTASLDPAGTKAVEEIVARVAASGVKVVFSTHDLGQARRLAADIVFLVGGRVAEHASVQNFFASPATSQGSAFVRGDLVV